MKRTSRTDRSPSPPPDRRRAPDRSARVLSSHRDFPGRPTAVVLVIGEPHLMARRLLDEVHQLAWAYQMNTRVLAAGNAPDTQLAAVLQAELPPDTPVYLVLGGGADAGGVAQVTAVLEQNGVATVDPTPLDPERHEAWTTLFGWFQQGSTPPSSLAADREGFFSQSGSAELKHPEVAKQRLSWVHEHRYFDAQQETVRQAHAMATRALGLAPPLDRDLRDAFNTLQFTPHWQAQASSAAAQAVCRLFEKISTATPDTRDLVEPLFGTLLSALTTYPPGEGDTGRIFASITQALTGAPDDVVEVVRRGCVAYMMAHVPAKLLDDRPQDAANFALAVHRHDLLAGILAQLLVRVRTNDERTVAMRVMMEAELRRVFDQGLTTVVRRAGHELPEILLNRPADEDPAIDLLSDAWDRMMVRSRRSFPEFLAQWDDWQAMIARRQRALQPAAPGH